MRRCSYPLTTLACVKTIITDIEVIDVAADGLRLLEVAPGVSLEDVQSLTEAALIVPQNVPQMLLTSFAIGRARIS